MKLTEKINRLVTLKADVVPTSLSITRNKAEIVTDNLSDHHKILKVLSEATTSLAGYTLSSKLRLDQQVVIVEK